MLTLMRHGIEESPERLHGWQDAKLVDKGVEQALRAADYFTNTLFKSAYTSDLSRASETAKIIANKQPALVPAPTPMLRSMNLGILNGQPYAEIEEKVNALWAEWRKGNDALRAPEGESWAEFQGRLYPFLFKMHEEASDAKVLAVSHSHVCDYAAAVAANGGAPLYGNALDLVKRFTVQPGQAVELSLDKVHRFNFIG